MVGAAHQGKQQRAGQPDTGHDFVLATAASPEARHPLPSSIRYLERLDME
jgi:hypothetical protein